MMRSGPQIVRDILKAMGVKNVQDIKSEDLERGAIVILEALVEGHDQIAESVRGEIQKLKAKVKPG